MDCAFKRQEEQWFLLLEKPPDLSVGSGHKSIASALLLLIREEIERVPPALDVESIQEGEDHILIQAINKHLSLVFEAVDFYTPEGMQIYVSMRELIEEQKARQKREYEEVWREKEAVDEN